MKALQESDLNESSIRSIEHEARNWELPEGASFDGSLYRDAFGAPLAHHPCDIISKEGSY